MVQDSRHPGHRRPKAVECPSEGLGLGNGEVPTETVRSRDAVASAALSGKNGEGERACGAAAAMFTRWTLRARSHICATARDRPAPLHAPGQRVGRRWGRARWVVLPTAVERVACEVLVVRSPPRRGRSCGCGRAR